MATWAYLLCITLMVASLSCGIVQGYFALQAGKIGLFYSRLKSPTIYIFAVYLIIAGLIAPKSEGETTSPLLLLGLVIPLHYFMASFTALQSGIRPLWQRILLSLVHGLSVMSSSFVIIAVTSPAFVPGFLR